MQQKEQQQIHQRECDLRPESLFFLSVRGLTDPQDLLEHLDSEALWVSLVGEESGAPRACQEPL